MLFPPDLTFCIKFEHVGGYCLYTIISTVVMDMSMHIASPIFKNNVLFICFYIEQVIHYLFQNSNVQYD